MLRVLVAVGLIGLLSGCSLNNQAASLGFGSPEPQRDASVPLFQRDLKPKTTARAPKKSQSNSRTRVAALDQRSQDRSYAKAPPGALSDRDYTRTALNVEVARAKINAYRKAKGLRPLKLSADLTRAAKAHSRDLAKWDRISHYGSDGSNPWDRVKRTGFRAQLAAENVGTGQATFDEVLTGWKNSPGHNKNLLLGDATHMGIALVNAPNTEFKTFWTLVIGTPM